MAAPVEGAARAMVARGQLVALVVQVASAALAARVAVVRVARSGW
jgi:hypothetical protein